MKSFTIKEIQVCGFGPFTDKVWALPDKGFVLVTGPNGSGKSTMVEAVATCGWDDTLRGKDMWDETAQKKMVQISLSTEGKDWTINRTPKKVFWWLDGEDQGKAEKLVGERYLTKTKAQPELERALGTFEHWYSTCVFSEKDMFTEMGDADRKRYIERLCDFQKLDTASKECRKDLNQLEREYSDSLLKLQGHQAVIKTLQSQLEEMKKNMPSAPLTTPLADTVKENTLRDRKQVLTDVIEHDRKSLREVHKALSDNKTDRALARKAIESVEDDQCEACGQLISSQHRNRVHSEADKTIDKMDLAIKVQETQIEQIENNIQKAEAELDTIKESLSDVRQAQREWAQRKNAIDQYAAQLKKLGEKIEDALDKETDMQASLNSMAKDINVLRVSDKVLSLSGIRAYILQHALTAIEEIANVWLMRLCDNIQIKLKPYKEDSTGTRETIQLEVLIKDQDHSYKGASSGQKKRVNIAIMLAMAELAEQSNKQRFNTMFFDEVFDSLDDNGVDRVIDAIKILSQKKCVVVITHNEQIKELLRKSATTHYAML